MSDWTAGYVADIGYTFGYYQELNPLRVKLAFLNSGLVCPEFGAACELGFGQGLSVNFHAAASVTTWHGTDFNPAQAGFAQDLSAVSGASAKLYDEAFAEFASRPDLPDFDYIGLHGIWSWISDENRKVIVDFIRRKLKVGGVLYISYNTLPGWAAFAPMRHLLTEHAEIIGAEGHGIVNRINGALDFAEKLIATNPGYAKANPQIAERIKLIKGQNRHYLAHEYFNRDWHPMHFATMAEWLSPAKLTFACSANYLDHVDALNLNLDQQTFLREIPDTMFRETVRDFMVNQQFRRDYWVKGARKISPLEQVEKLRSEKVILITPRPSISLKVIGALGEASLNEAVYAPILDYLADHRARSIAEIESAVAKSNVSFDQVRQAILILSAAGHMATVQDSKIIADARKRTEKLNGHLVNKARATGDIGYLVSPVIGSGVGISRFAQLFLLATNQGKKDAADLARFVWSQISAQGQKIVKDGKTLESDEENIAELTTQADAFLAKQLPILRALQIAS